MRIALLGYGTVGKGFTEIVDKQSNLQIVKILRHHAHQLDEDRMCLDIEEIIQDPTIDLVVEAMSGIEPAYTYVRKALVSQKHVVSANKAMIALHQLELHALAASHQVTFRYEASCGGGIPWLMSLMKAQRVDEITRYHGIFNGTCNYILDQMTASDMSFDYALKEAQAKGFAEHDPTDDIEGFDTQRKAIITSRVAFHLQDIHTSDPIGITQVKPSDIQLGKQMGCVLKLLACGKAIHDAYETIVEPVYIPMQFMEADVHAQYNIVTLHGETIGNLTFSGQGAGGFPTANALIQDVLDIQDHILFKPSFAHRGTHDESMMNHTYIMRSRLPEEAIQALFPMYRVEIGNGTKERYYIVHQIPAHSFHESRKQLMIQDPQSFCARILTEAL